jgi:hypothetical protein
MAPGTRVCPFCGEPPGVGVFCAACGRNLSDVQQLPTRGEWEGEHAEPPAPAGTLSAAEAVAAFLVAMHAAGDPGATKVARAEPGFLGRTQHAHGWLVRAGGGDDAAPDRDRPGLFLTVDGHLHHLTSATRGLGQRDGVRYVDIVGPEVTALDGEERLAGELAAVLGANGLGAVSL